jgi:hypothetical protein
MPDAGACRHTIVAIERMLRNPAGLHAHARDGRVGRLAGRQLGLRRDLR